MSSRNAYLSSQDRRRALCCIVRSMGGKAFVKANECSETRAAGRAVIAKESEVRLDYFEIVDPEDELDPVETLQGGVGCSRGICWPHAADRQHSFGFLSPPGSISACLTSRARRRRQQLRARKQTDSRNYIAQRKRGRFVNSDTGELRASLHTEAIIPLSVDESRYQALFPFLLARGDYRFRTGTPWPEALFLEVGDWRIWSCHGAQQLPVALGLGPFDFAQGRLRGRPSQHVPRALAIFSMLPRVRGAKKHASSNASGRHEHSSRSNCHNEVDVGKAGRTEQTELRAVLPEAECGRRRAHFQRYASVSQISSGKNSRAVRQTISFPRMRAAHFRGSASNNDCVNTGALSSVFIRELRKKDFLLLHFDFRLLIPTCFQRALQIFPALPRRGLRLSHY